MTTRDDDQTGRRPVIELTSWEYMRRVIGHAQAYRDAKKRPRPTGEPGGGGAGREEAPGA